MSSSGIYYLLMKALSLVYLAMVILTFITGISVRKFNKSLWILNIVIGAYMIMLIPAMAQEYLDWPIERSNNLYFASITFSAVLSIVFFWILNANFLMRISTVIALLVAIALTIYLDDPILDMDYRPAQIVRKIRVVSGLLVFMMSVWTISSIKPENQISYYEHPTFWICSGYVVFYSSSVFSTIIQNYIPESDHFYSFWESVGIIQLGIDMLFLVSLIIGFLCSQRITATSYLRS